MTKPWEYHYTRDGHGVLDAVRKLFSGGAFLLGEGDALCTCGTCMVNPADYDDDFEPDEDEEEFDCHLMPNGQCLAAGSEDCDWNCPYRDSEHFAGSKAWMRAKGSACQKCGEEIEDGEEPGEPRTCRKCSGLGKYEDETGFDLADHPDAGGPAGR